jgi:hypothetical protein
MDSRNTFVAVGTLPTAGAYSPPEDFSDAGAVQANGLADVGQRRSGFLRSGEALASRLSRGFHVPLVVKLSALRNWRGLLSWRPSARREPVRQPGTWCDSPAKEIIGWLVGHWLQGTAIRRGRRLACCHLAAGDCGPGARPGPLLGEATKRLAISLDRGLDPDLALRAVAGQAKAHLASLGLRGGWSLGLHRRHSGPTAFGIAEGCTAVGQSWASFTSR